MADVVKWSADGGQLPAALKFLRKEVISNYAASNS
jgi:hypothetical protein